MQVWWPAVLVCAIPASVWSASLEAGLYQIRFREQLGIQRDLRLSGSTDSASVRFLCETTSRPGSGSELHLFVRHSPVLDENRSFLTVTLNYGILRSTRLGSDNQELTEVVIPLPPSLLRPENQLVFSVEQRPPGVVRPEQVWTEVGAKSYIIIQPEAGSLPPELSALPSPLVDPYSYRPQVFDVVVPDRFSAETLEATALLIANLSKRAVAGSVKLNVVRSIRAAHRPVLMAGTLREQPELANLSLPRLMQQEGLAGFAGPAPALFVTGATPAAVLNAARSLVVRLGQLSGSLFRAGGPVRLPEVEARDWKGYIPRESRFRLEDLGFEELKLGAEAGSILTVPLHAPPDCRFLDYQSSMTLMLRFDPALWDLDAKLAVTLNGTSLGHYPVREMSRRPVVSLKIGIPAGLLQPRNALELALEGSLPPDRRRNLAVLLPQSHFYFPHEYRTELPDLSLLKFGLYPLSLKPDLSDVMIVLPDALTEPVFRMLAEFSLAVGRHTPSERVGLQVRTAQQLTAEEWRGLHLVLLADASAALRPETLIPGWPAIPGRHSRRWIAKIQEIVSPWNPEKVVLSISASRSDAPQEAVRRLFSNEVLESLAGDVAVLANSGLVTYRLAPRRTLRESSFPIKLEAWLTANWFALPLTFSFMSGILFLALRLGLRRYKYHLQQRVTHRSRSGAR